MKAGGSVPRIPILRGSMNRLVRSYFKKKSSFFWVAQEGAKPFHLKAPLFLIHALLLVMAGLLAWAGVLVTKNVDYRLALLNEESLEGRLRKISKEMEANRQVLSQMAKVDTQFRKLLKLRDRKKVFALGMGGPTEEDSAKFSKLLEEKNEEMLSKVQLGLRETNQVAAQQEKSFKEISVYLDKQRSILASTPSIWPVRGWITSGFGKRASPLTGEPGRHMGVDIANETNTPIRSTADGMVTYAGWQEGYGRVVVVEHGYGYSTRYGHC